MRPESGVDTGFMDLAYDRNPLGCRLGDEYRDLWILEETTVDEFLANHVLRLCGLQPRHMN